MFIVHQQGGRIGEQISVSSGGRLWLGWWWRRWWIGVLWWRRCRVANQTQFGCMEMTKKCTHFHWKNAGDTFMAILEGSRHMCGYLQAMIATNTNPITPMMIIILRFCSQNLFFNLPACCSNCEAPCCNASARSSSSDSFWSRSNTFSTFVFIMSTT